MNVRSLGCSPGVSGTSSLDPAAPVSLIHASSPPPWPPFAGRASSLTSVPSRYTFRTLFSALFRGSITRVRSPDSASENPCPPGGPATPGFHRGEPSSFSAHLPHGCPSHAPPFRPLSGSGRFLCSFFTIIEEFRAPVKSSLAVSLSSPAPQKMTTVQRRRTLPCQRGPPPCLYPILI